MIRWRTLLVLASTSTIAACGTILDLPDPQLDESIGKGGDTGQGSGGSTSSSTGGSGATGGGSTGGAGGSGGAVGGSGGTGGQMEAAQLLVNGRVRKIELDDTSIYWTEDLDAKVGRIEKDGSNQVLLAAGLSNAGFYPFSLAIDDTDVYWSALDEIRKCAKSGCANNPTILVNDQSGYDPGGIEVDGQFVYFGHYIDAGQVSLHKVPKTGGAVTEILGPAEFCAGSEYNRIDLAAGHLYWTCDDGEIGRVPTGGGPAEVLSGPAPPASPGAFVVSGATMYFAQFLDQGSIYFLSTSGYQAGFGTLALGQENTNGITADGQFLYWLNVGGPLPDNGSGTLVRCAIADCNNTVEEIEPFQDIPQVPQVDATHVYWANWGNGFTAKSGIWKKAK